MSNNYYGYGDSYNTASNRAQTSQSSNANLPASNATSYYGLPATDNSARTYSNNDTQYGQYSQVNTSGTNGLYGLGTYRGTTTTGADGWPTTDQQSTVANTNKAQGQTSYDNSSLSNLGYGSTMNYDTSTTNAQPTNSYTAQGLYSTESTRASEDLTAQRSNQQYGHNKTSSIGTRSAQVTGTQSSKRATDSTQRANTSASYQRPSPSSAYPTGLVNAFSQSSSYNQGGLDAFGNTATAAVPRIQTTAATNATTTDSTSYGTQQQQQPRYSPATTYSYAQPATAARLSPEQMRKTQTPTPPMRNATPDTSSNTYRSQAQQRQATQSHAQASRSKPATRSQPAANAPPVNVIIPAVGRAPPTQQNKQGSGQNGNTSSYTPQQQNWSNSLYQKQSSSQAQGRSSNEQPTTVDPSQVYNRFHEYQKQIREAEAETARLKQLEEEKQAAEAKAAEEKRLEEMRLQQEAEAEQMRKQHEEQLAETRLRQAFEAENAAQLQAASILVEDLPAQHNQASAAPPAMGEGETPAPKKKRQTKTPKTATPRVRKKKGAAAASTETPSQQPQQTPQQSAAPAMDTPMMGGGEMTEAMEEEMRKTIEKLKAFQSKDPNLFSKVWSTSVQNNGGPSGSPAPQAAGATMGGPPAEAAHSPGLDGQQVFTQNSPYPPKVKGKPRGRPKKLAEGQTTEGQNMFIANEVIVIDSSASEAPPPILPPGAKRPPGRPKGSKTKNRKVSLLGQGLPIAPATPDQQAGPSDQGLIDPRLQDANANQTWTPPDAQSHQGFAIPQGGLGGRPVSTPKTGTPSQAPPAGQLWPESSAAGASAGRGQAGANMSKGTPKKKSPKGKNKSPQKNTKDASAQASQAGTSSAPGNKPAPAQSGTGAQNNASPSKQPAAASAGQGAPKPGPATSHWPIEHIELIANTGSTLLNSLPQNANKKIPSETILNLLRKDISYVGLCEEIEKLGFHMDRVKFAKAVLTVIAPNGGGTAGKPAAQSQAAAPAPAAAPQSAPAPAGQTRTSMPPTAALAAASPSLANRPATAPPVQNARAPPANVGQLPPDQPASGEGFQFVSGARPISRGAQGPNQGQGSASNGPAQNAPAAHDDGPMFQMDGGDDEEDRRRLSLLQAYNNSSNAPNGAQGAPNNPASQYYPNRQQVPNGSGQQGMPDAKKFSSYTEFWRQTGNSRIGIHQATKAQASPSITAPSLPQAPPPAPPAPPASRSWNQMANPPQPPIGSFRPPAGPGPQPQFPNQQQYAPYPNLHVPPGGQKRPFPQMVDLTRDDPSKRPRPAGWGNNNVPDATRDLARDALRVNSMGAPAPYPPQGQPAPGYPNQNIETPPYPNLHNNQDFPEPQVRRAVKNPLLEFQGIVKRIDKSKVKRRVSYNPKTIARDILIATGRHPHQRPLNAHLEPLKNFNKVDAKSDLSSFRWDIVDPGGAEVGSANKKDDKMRPTRGNPFNPSFREQPNPSRLRHVFGNDDDDDGIMASGDEKPARDGTPRTEASSNMDIPANAGRGRDGDKNAKTNGNRKAVAESNSNRRISARESKNSTPRYRPMTAAEIKGHGSSMRSSAIRRARQQSTASSSDAGHPPQRFSLIPCKWRNCGKKLMNIETLLNHVKIAHGEAPADVGIIKCLWEGCGDDEFTGKDRKMGPVFRDLKVFVKHVQEVHMKDMQSLYGDGVRADTLDGNESDATLASSSYLFDSDSHQVTPSVSGQKSEGGDAYRKNEERHLRKKERAKKKSSRAWILKYWSKRGLASGKLHFAGEGDVRKGLWESVETREDEESEESEGSEGEEVEMTSDDEF